MTLKTYAMTTDSGEVVTFQTTTDLPAGDAVIEFVGFSNEGGGATTNGGGGPDPVKPT